jgi:MFS family permease
MKFFVHALVLPSISKSIIRSSLNNLAQVSTTRLFLEPEPEPEPSSLNPLHLTADLDGVENKGLNVFSSYTFVFLSALAMAISYADRSNLSTAIIPMARELKWDNLFSGFVLSAFWGGYATTQIIGGALADGFGGEFLLVLAMLLWSIATAFTPAAAAAGPVQIISARILLGAGEGLALPAIHSMINKYVVYAQRSLAAATVTSACYLGALTSNFLAPKIIEKFDWQTCFYGFAAIPSLIWIPLWILFLRFGLKSRESTSELGTTAETSANRDGGGGGRTLQFKELIKFLKSSIQQSNSLKPYQF